MGAPGGMLSMFPFITLYSQNVLSTHRSKFGLRLVPLTLLSFFVAPAAARTFTATFRAASDRCDAGRDRGWFAFATKTGPADACDPGGR